MYVCWFIVKLLFDRVQTKNGQHKCTFTKFKKGIESNLEPGVKHCAGVCLCVRECAS